MDTFQVGLYYLRDRTQLLPSDKGVVYGCEPGTGNPYGIRVKFKPNEASFHSTWKVHLLIDGKNVGYSLPVSSPSSDGFWRARFECVRANSNFTETHQLVFEVPTQGTGECGVIECELEGGHYDTSVEKPPVDDNWESSEHAGVSSASTSTSTSTSDGTVCTGRGKRMRANGFSNRGMWVSGSATERRRIHYTADPYPSSF